MKTKLSQQLVNINADNLLAYTEKMLCGKEEPHEGKEELNNFLAKIKEIDASKLTTSSLETETFFSIAKHILVYMTSKVSLNRDYTRLLAK